jgi:5-methylcytosine-specific restriction enzyme subunit McrC
MSAVFEKFIRRFYELEQSEFPSVGTRSLSWEATAERAEDLEFLPNMRTDVTLRSPDRVIEVPRLLYHFRC